MKELSQARKLIKECQEDQNPYLDLGKCGITNLEKLPELFECSHLKTLILSNTWWDMDKSETESPNPGKDNIINSIPEKISKLTKLETLILAGDPNRNWGIFNISMLENLTCLHLLDISRNRISDIGALAKLIRLKDLDISYNHLSDVGVLGNFTDLLYLGLSDNELTDISKLEKLTKLQRLYLGNNRISDIGILKNLTSLQRLYLNNNQISDISALEKLIGLQELYLSFNQISDISFLKKQAKLKVLDLRYNRIDKFPLSIFQLKIEVNRDRHGLGNGIFLYENPMELPPLEIIRQGEHSVLDWLNATKKKLNEIKVILIGDPKAGKTSLLKKIKDNEFNENEPQTDGINIADIAFGECEMFKNQTSLRGIIGHFWDFGGQEIMTATHQLFLTKRSVYVLVLHARYDANIPDQIRKWVRQIRATGGDSPIIILANQIDINPRFGFVNERELREEFPQIKYLIKVSCKTDENIELFKDKLAELIPTADLFQTDIDERWIRLKEKLQEETGEKFFLNEDHFSELCNQVGLSIEQEQNNAVRFLHDLGLVLHFEKLKASSYYVLNPRWITCGVYRILTSSYAAEKKGFVNMDKLEYIVNEEKKNEKTSVINDGDTRPYLRDERRFLIEALRQFKLCYCVGDDYFIIPDLLDANEPSKVTDLIRSANENIQFVYKYDYLPKSIMPNIMVDMHHNIIYKWRTGCIFEYDSCKALITTNDNKITIMVIGKHKAKRQCMSVVRGFINKINDGLSIKPCCQIPLPGIKNGYVDYEMLLNRERKGKSDYIFDDCGPAEQTFKISKLLDGIEEISEEMKSLEEIKTGIKNLTSLSEKMDKRINEDLEAIIIEAIRKMSDEQMKSTIDWLTGALNALDWSIDDKFDDFMANFERADSTQTKLQIAFSFLGLSIGKNVNIRAIHDKLCIRLGLV